MPSFDVATDWDKAREGILGKYRGFLDMASAFTLLSSSSFTNSTALEI